MRPRRHRVTYQDEQEIRLGAKKKLEVPVPAASEVIPKIEFQEEVNYVFELKSEPTTEQKSQKVEIIRINAEPSDKEVKTAFKKKKKFSLSEWQEGEQATKVLSIAGKQ